MLDQFEAGQIDLALFGGYSYVLAREQSNAIPIVMRNVDRNYTTVFISTIRHVGREFAHFKGSRFAFGSELSTSGHLMPRMFLARQGIEPETFFSAVRYSGSHDKTAELIRDGECELGAADSLVIRGMIRTGKLKENEVIVLGETDPYADYVWAAHPSVSARLRSKIRIAFMELAVLNPVHALVLADQNANSFLPALDREFDGITEALGVLPKQMRAAAHPPLQ